MANDNEIMSLCSPATFQEDLAFKQKQREDKKKLEEAKARAGQKGPMGRYNRSTDLYKL